MKKKKYPVKILLPYGHRNSHMNLAIDATYADKKAKVTRNIYGFTTQLFTIGSPSFDMRGEIQIGLEATYELWEEKTVKLGPHKSNSVRKEYEGWFSHIWKIPFRLEDNGDFLLNAADLVLQDDITHTSSLSGDNMVDITNYRLKAPYGSAKKGQTYVFLQPYFGVPQTSRHESTSRTYGLSHILEANGTESTGRDITGPAVVFSPGSVRVFIGVDERKLRKPPEPTRKKLQAQVRLKIIFGENRTKFTELHRKQVLKWKEDLYAAHPELRSAIRTGKLLVRVDGNASMTGSRSKRVGDIEINDKFAGERADELAKYIREKTGAKVSMVNNGRENAKWRWVYDDTVDKLEREPRPEDTSAIVWLDVNEVEDFINRNRKTTKAK